MLFSATQMDLEIIILSEVSQKKRQIPHDLTHMWNLKYDTNEPIYETETDSQTQRLDFWLPRGREVGEEKIGRLGLDAIYCNLLYIDAKYYIQDVNIYTYTHTYT